MKILVAIKQVAARDSQFVAGAGGKWIEEDGLEYEINEPDAYALEEALQLREEHGGEVVVMCAGPERAGSALREALAKGADRAIHIEVEAPEEWDTLSMARLLAAAARGEGPDLVLTGLQSDDLGAGQTGVVMAELLGMPHGTIVMQVEIGEGVLRVKRELEDGLYQYVGMPMPAVLTIQSGIKKLRYATLMGIKKAKTKEVKVVGAGDLGVELRPAYEVLGVNPPLRLKQTQMVGGVGELVEKLKNEARVL
ncbi:MAG: electron transfer flavoprotein subunit beta/FixA family protein [Acidobacteriota bacterium]